MDDDGIGKIIFTIILILIIFLVLFVILWLNYRPFLAQEELNYAFTLPPNGIIPFTTYWFSIRCRIKTKDGRFLAPDNNENLVATDETETISEWVYIYQNSNTSIGTFQNIETGKYMNFSTDLPNEPITVDIENFDINKIFNVLPRSNTYVSISIPINSSLVVTVVNDFCVFNVFNDPDSLFKIISV